jgi:hypothetical protein
LPDWSYKTPIPQPYPPAEYYPLYPTMEYGDIAAYANQILADFEDQTEQRQQLQQHSQYQYSVAPSSDYATPATSWGYADQKWHTTDQKWPTTGKGSGKQKVNQPRNDNGAVAYQPKSRTKHSDWDLPAPPPKQQVHKRDPWTVRGVTSEDLKPHTQTERLVHDPVPSFDGSNTPPSVSGANPVPKEDESDGSQISQTTVANGPRHRAAGERGQSKRGTGFDMIWCDESAFRSTSEEKRREIHHFGYDNVRCFKSPENCVRSMEKRIGDELNPKPCPPVTVAIVSARNAVVIPYLAAKAEQLRMRGVIVLLNSRQKRHRFDETFKTVPIVVGIATGWEDAMAILQSPAMTARLPSNRGLECTL